MFKKSAKFIQKFQVSKAKSKLEPKPCQMESAYTDQSATTPHI
jgi:hypothetical protein